MSEHLKSFANLPPNLARYGGQFVPETLMPALDELEAAYVAAPGRPGLSGRAGRTAARLRRPADPADPRRAA